MIVSAVESQSTAGSTAIATSATTAGSSDTTGLTARKPPIVTETAAATNPTHDLDLMPRMPMWFARPKTVIHHIIIIVYYAEAAQHTKKV